jgi:hypothetical protein
MNNENLKPFNTWTAEAHRQASIKGGIASGKARRRKAAIRAYVSQLLEAYHECEQEAKEITRQEYNARKRAERARRISRQQLEVNRTQTEQPGH